MEPQKITSEDENCTEYKCTSCLYSTRILRHYKQHQLTHSSEKPFKCPECPFTTKRKGCLKTHLTNVHVLKSPSASRPFPCPHPGCNYAAKQKFELQSHSKVHSDEKSFFCSHPNCNYSTNQKKCLMYHIRIHTGEKPFVCQLESCSYAAANRSDLVKHTRIHTKEKPFKCPEENCDYSSANSTSLKQHQLVHHPKDGEERPSFLCPLCEYKSEHKPALSRHIERHTLEKLFKCDEPNCQFEAKGKKEIKQHKVVHSDEKPFACSFESCEYRCKFKCNLSRHLQIHSDEKQYKCELCPYRAKQRGIVAHHLQNVHSEIRNFKCKHPDCDYAAKTKATLNQHSRIHEAEQKCSSSLV